MANLASPMPFDYPARTATPFTPKDGPSIHLGPQFQLRKAGPMSRLNPMGGPAMGPQPHSSGVGAGQGTYLGGMSRAGMGGASRLSPGSMKTMQHGIGSMLAQQARAKQAPAQPDIWTTFKTSPSLQESMMAQTHGAHKFESKITSSKASRTRSVVKTVAGLAEASRAKTPVTTAKTAGKTGKPRGAHYSSILQQSTGKQLRPAIS